MSRFFISIYRYFQTRKAIFYVTVIALFVVFGYFSTRIKLEEDITQFMPNTPETEKASFILKNLSTNDKIIIKLSLKDSLIPDAQNYLAAWSDSLADSLNIYPEKDYINDIFYKIDESQIFETYDFVLQNLPIFLKESDYSRLDSMLSPNAIGLVLERTKKDLASPMGMIYQKFLIADPLNISGRVFTTIQSNAVDSLYKISNGYIFSKDGKNLLIFISTRYGLGETGKNQILADALEKNIQSIVQRSSEKLEVTSFGAALVGVSNASQIKKDSYLSTGISLLLIILLLGIFFKSGRSLFLLMVPIVFGVAFSLTILVLIKGTISAIAVGAGSAILGIAINYTLHFLVHNKHSQSVEHTIKDLVSPLLVGSITTIGAFLSLLFVSSEALRDFGLFAALALGGTILFVLIFMPHLISQKEEAHYSAFFDRISDVQLDKNKWVILTIVVLTVIFGFFSGKLTFESDMNKISYMTPAQKQAFNELSGFTTLAQKSLIHVSEGNDMNEAFRNYEVAKVKIDSLVRIQQINSVSGIGEMLPSDSLQQLKINRWNAFWGDKSSSLRQEFESQSVKLGFREKVFERFLSSTEEPYTIISADELMAGTAFTSNYIINREGRNLIINLLYVNPENDKAVTKALGALPGTYIFDRASTTKAIINVLSNDFNVVLVVCGLLVLFFLTLSFGRIELSLLTFIPMVIAWIWILGLMAIFNVKFNIVNIILATFIFGLGDDYSIFIMEGSIHENAYRRKILRSYKLAVILSALTMFIGIGSLIFAKHPAMKSLAQVTIIGMISVVVISYTILPFLYRWLTTKQGKKRVMPLTAKNIFNSTYSFLVFLIGSIILSLIGLWLFKITKSNDQKKLFFHKCLFFTANFVVYRIPGVKTRLINRYGEDFMKPAVIICNHQSHIDLMLIMMLTPRVVILTNKWVWNSPFYGSIVKYADFYPVANGVENSIEPLEKLIQKGYSIMVFPEGTRSEDCSINRFHKGAFFLAEQLNIDILPVMIHGIGHALPKTDFLLRKGNVTVEILNRITPTDKSFGETYSHRAKYVRRMYREQYSRLAAEVETPSYYSDKVFHNYIYKGVQISTKVSIDLKKHNDYNEIIQRLPSTGRVLVLGSGLGTFSLLLSMVKPQLVIENVEENEEQLWLAQNCASRTQNLNYIQDSPLNFSISTSYDAIVILDCLSTYNPQEQKEVIRKYLSLSEKIIISDIPYNSFQKIRLKLAGNEVTDIRQIEPSKLRLIGDKAGVRIETAGYVTEITQTA